MASKSRDITLATPSHVTYGLARAAGSELPGFRIRREDPAGYYLKFARGFGWTNPTDVEVTVYQLDAQTSQLRLNASILALLDPFGFLDSALDRAYGRPRHRGIAARCWSTSSSSSRCSACWG
jgi:hypothetical protein